MSKKKSKTAQSNEHTAISLFKKNIQSAQDCIDQYQGLLVLKSGLNTEWLLRAAVVFIVSALDTYFHDKIKYKVGKLSLNNLPTQLQNFEITIGKLPEWTKAKRKGNVIRNWIVEYLSIRPIQKPDLIAEYLKLVGIDNFWNTMEPDNKKRSALRDDFSKLIKRRNQIAHEGDRLQSRASGKKLRTISKEQVDQWKSWSEKFVNDIEKHFPG